MVSNSLKFSLDYIGFYANSRSNRKFIVNNRIGFVFKGSVLFENLRSNFVKMQEKNANDTKFAKFAKFQKFEVENLVDFEKW